jgi:hypothetical protein
MAVTQTNSSGGQNTGRRLFLETKLEITSSTFSNETLLHLIDDSIVPALVEQFLRPRADLRAAAERGHNVGQP